MGDLPGKKIGGRTYVHIDTLSALDADWFARVENAKRLAQVTHDEHFNVVRIDDSGPCISLLNYPDFFDDPFPALANSWNVDLDKGSVNYRTYNDSLNPPILHRKELLLPPDHPRREEYAALTAMGESIGLFDEPKRIGYRRQWLALVREKGYRIEGHALVPLGNDESVDAELDEEITARSGWQASRHLTALVRYGFSAPVQSLARYGKSDHGI
jgi:DNA phosphorothioation-associated putative methyltransferase